MTVIIKFGMESLIDSTMEIISNFFDIHKKNEEVKDILHNCVADLRSAKRKLEIYKGKEAKGHIVANNQFYEVEDLIKKVLTIIFEIDILHQERRVTSAEMVKYKAAVSSLLNQTVKCKSYALKESDKLPKIIGNTALKRNAYKCKHVIKFINKEKFLAMEGFDKVCTDVGLDPGLLKQVIDLCSFSIIFGFLDLCLVQFLVEMRFFPTQNTNTINITRDNYIKLMHHIILYKCSQFIEEEGVNMQIKKLPYFSINYVRSNIPANSCMYLGITVFGVQCLLNMFGVLLVFLHVNNMVNLYDVKHISIGVCSINITLTVVALVLVFVGKNLRQKDDTLLTNMDVSNLSIIRNMDL